ncbi:uncharacterized protein MKK02DRAFT_38504 [Dioszegia hungarica]|uniref:Uncharacterized protein n=1 Tax=Dioszegia hungarica TaxID=4972 RepID=A0AA38LS66_9TREE|nr:uncharacterized protein MKK02DRAFT_38504 [Dioszegia hungarica]KAI9633840.1 hypothetical protein MKK02DRAFT_38504 [Dioszegia hungarica]
MNTPSTPAPSTLPFLIWSLIAPHLQRPAPLPLSKPSRSVFGQGDICLFMLVCKDFANIGYPLLYTHIVTDALHLLLEDIIDPAMHPRFSYTKSLKIEYSVQRGDLPLYDLLRHGGHIAWSYIGMDKVPEALAMQSCEVEADHLGWLLQQLNKAGAKEVFPKLETVAIGSIYGTESDLWRRFAKYLGDDKTILDLCAAECEAFLSNTGAKHYCNREVHGPLSTSPLQLASSAGSLHRGILSIVHFNKDIDQLPIIFGSPMRYVSDISSTENWASTLATLSTSLARQILARILHEQTGGTATRSDAVDMEIYCSSSGWARGPVFPFYLRSLDLCSHHDSIPSGQHQSVEKQRSMATALGPVLEKAYVGRDGLQPLIGNSVRFFPSADTPLCPACGSGVPA